MRIFVYLLFLLYVTMIMQSCAVNGTIGGGPKDTVAPKLVEEKSAKTGATNFLPKEILFEFDEFIDVKDVLKQVFVSPPTKYIPKVRARGKHLIFAFNEEEVLRENTTYTINFGEAVRDYNEGIKLQNFTYVFSTGDKIDSLSISGKVIDLATGKGSENITVMLYDNLSDSALVKEKPFYFAKTIKDGLFKINNIKNDSFRIIAINDANSSYTWNDATEEIAFTDSLVFWSDSIVSIKRNLTLSKPDLKLKVFNVNSKLPGVLKAKLNQPLKEVPKITALNGVTLYPSIKEDSLFLRYGSGHDSIVFGMFDDTFNVKTPKFISITDTLLVTTSFATTKFNPFDSMVFKLSKPCDTINVENMILRDSTDNTIPFNATLGVNNVTLVVKSAFPQSSKLTLSLFPGALKDIYGNINKGLNLNIKTVSEEALGKIILNISDLDSTKAYICNFLIGNTILSTKYVSDVSNFIWVHKNLIAESYKVQIIEDVNRNYKRDAILYWQKKQAETSITKELEKLRENWTLESKVSWIGKDN